MTEITKEQLAVIEAAEAWNKRYQDSEDRGNAYRATRCILSEAVDALPEPYVPLVSFGELQKIWDRDGPITTMREAGTMTLRAAADRFEEMQLEDHHGYLREWADEEEKLNK